MLVSCEGIANDQSVDIFPFGCGSKSSACQAGLDRYTRLLGVILRGRGL